MTDDSTPSPAPAAPGPPAGSPSYAERLQLVDALQARAVRQPDPLQANLEVISGDLLRLLHRAWQDLAPELSAPGGAGPSARKLDLYLRLAKEASRMAMAGRQRCRHARTVDET